ncbi:hypothetical protein GLYMA_04G243700v4 [Glycine max]|uniref:Uncharacterized protein n=1 Tax=Glycine max TaxID=3847 RepID=K7KM49_SOYBN|nr:hypothetical protein GYH30_010966 [Glycine max]KRH64589.1 hypothetical protein GLYMA_04G243700v4 [Glycine max]
MSIGFYRASFTIICLFLNFLFLFLSFSAHLNMEHTCGLKSEKMELLIILYKHTFVVYLIDYSANVSFPP